MKSRMAMLFFIILLLSSCGFLVPFLGGQEEWNYSFNDGGMTFTSLDSLCLWAADSIVYDSDIDHWGYSEYWASPEQTFASHKGDCEDKAILFMYFAHSTRLSPDPLLVAVRMSGNTGHALVRVGSVYYDPTYGAWGAWSDLTNPVMYTLNYGEAMYIATHDHDAIRSMARAVPLDAAAR
jgi:hypothetical protein